MVRLRFEARARPFVFVNLGKLAYLGGGEAISQIEFGSKKLLSEAVSGRVQVILPERLSADTLMVVQLTLRELSQQDARPDWL